MIDPDSNILDEMAAALRARFPRLTEAEAAAAAAEIGDTPNIDEAGDVHFRAAGEAFRIPAADLFLEE